MNMNN